MTFRFQSEHAPLLYLSVGLFLLAPPHKIGPLTPRRNLGNQPLAHRPVAAGDVQQWRGPRGRKSGVQGEMRLAA